MKKVVFTGDAGVGKTCLLSAICGGGSFDPEHRPTVMEDRDVAFETRDRRSGRGGPGGTKVEVRVRLSDTSGDEAYDRLRPLSYLDADLAVLCFSLSSPPSLRSATDRWRSELRHFLPAAPVVVVGTKADEREKLRAAAEEGAGAGPGEGAGAVTGAGAEELGRRRRSRGHCQLTNF